MKIDDTPFRISNYDNMSINDIIIMSNAGDKFKSSKTNVKCHKKENTESNSKYVQISGY